jgi:hypothetical protein
MNLFRGIAVLAGLSVLMLLQCSFDANSMKPVQSAGGSATINLVASSGSSFSTLAKKANALVTAEGMDSILQALSVNSTGITGTIAVIPAGFNRKFEVFVYDSTNKLCYYGSSYADVAVGGVVNVSMNIYRCSGSATGGATITGTIIDSVPTATTNKLPVVAITSPVNNATCHTGDTITINATATDSDGTVKVVRFYTDSTLLGSDSTSPFSYKLIAAAGTYRFKAVAVDNQNGTGTSSVITVTVSAAQYTVTASAGANGTISPTGTVTTNVGMAVTFTITPSSGYSTSQLLVDGASVTVASTYTFPATTTGSHTISATFAASTASKLTISSAKASSVNGGNVAANAIDNNMGTRWESTQGVDPQWIYVDIGAGKTVSSVILFWEAANAKNYTLEASNDSTFATKTTLVTKTNMANKARNDTLTGLNASFRYIRMYGTARNLTYGYSIWEFQVYGSNSAVPAAPTLSAPANTATNVSLNTAFSWNAAAGATSYFFEASPSSDFTTNVLESAGLTSPAFTATGLLSGTLYYWRVYASNATGNGGWSATWTFTTAVPVLSAPANAATNVATNATFSWSAVAGATSYFFEASPSSDFTINVLESAGLTSPAFTANSLLSGTLYYWRVYAVSVSGNGSWSPTWTFTTAPPILSAPANGATGVSLNTAFSWNAVPGATSYFLEASPSSDFTINVLESAGLTSPAFTATGLISGTLYYWRVYASNAIGTGGWSATWTFTTALPVLSAPANAATNVATNPTFSWSAVPGATSYFFEASPSSDFTINVFEAAGLTSPTVTANLLLSGTKYYWRVYAVSVSGIGSWSPTWTFTTAPPILSAPANGATGVSLNTAFSWNAVAGATSYFFEASPSPDFTINVLESAGLTSPAVTATGLLSGTLYYWRVYASNAIGNGGWSATWTFTTTAQ